jgi:phosphatidylinositol alpha-1,6-mannosyltransferase
MSALLWKPEVVYLQDGLLAPLGWAVSRIARLPTTITIHGLEVTYDGSLYRRLVLPFIAKQTRIVAVSHATKRAAEARLGPMGAVVIHNGVADEFFDPSADRSVLAALLEADAGWTTEEFDSMKILHTAGRLIDRKGVLWFVENVVPRLVAGRDDLFYFVSGAGPQARALEAAIVRLGLEHSVALLGRVPDELRDALYNCADVFVMPNIPTEHDMEGFGLVALEAASCGTPVVAARTGGIVDAVIDGETGFLVPPGDAAAFIEKLRQVLDHPPLAREDVRSATIARYSWSSAARGYARLFQEL